MISVLICKSITVVMLPLNQIEKEQAEYISQIDGRLCLLNAETINKKILVNIQNEKYTHILISPELGVGDKFHETVTHSIFKERLTLVVIDEAHLVSQWGRDFRSAYARLGQLRSLFGDSVPWFACSATLDTATLEAVKKGCGFDNDVTIMRTSIDRPELAIILSWIPNKQRKNATALRFLFDGGTRADTESPARPQRIPKTVVFFDSKQEAYRCQAKCRNWLQRSSQHIYSEKQANETIKVFHRDTAKFDKETIIAEFQRLAEDSSIRVIFATEAMGSGVNLPDVRRVVQYGLPKGEDIATFLQRGGRAGRDGLDGEMILLIDTWVKGPRMSFAANQNQPGIHKSRQKIRAPDEDGPTAGQTKTALTLAERRSKLPNFWYMLANETDCLRLRFLAHFNEPKKFHVRIRKDRCCSNCNPELNLDELDKYYLYNERGNNINKRRKLMLERLTSWGESQLAAAFPDALFQPIVSSFISDDQLMQLVKDAHIITNLEDLRRALGSWYFFPSHGAELLKELRAVYYGTDTSHKSPQKANSVTKTKQL